MTVRSVVSLSDLCQTGVSVEPYDGPRFRVSPMSAWPLGVLVVGTIAISWRAELLGREVAWVGLAVIYVGGVALFAAMHVRAVLGLKRFRSLGFETLGWGFDMFGTKPLPKIRSDGVRRRIGTAIVAVVLGEDGLRLHIDHSDVGFVGPAEGYALSIGHRRRRYWVIVRLDGDEVALRIHQCRITTMASRTADGS